MIRKMDASKNGFMSFIELTVEAEMGNICIYI